MLTSLTNVVLHFHTKTNYPKPWDKQRDHFPALNKLEEAAASEVYHFHQAASLHWHYMLRESLPKHELVVI